MTPLSEAPDPAGDLYHAYVLTHLRVARAKIASPDHWIKGALAVDASGRRTRSHYPEAVRWSLDGVLGNDVQTRLYLTRIVGRPVFEFENAAKTTHADVLNLIDSAIERQERAHAIAAACH